jgi:outer membrane receptor protein involved in Fe transport
VDYVEAQRGSYMADFGDRTYGIFNVVPRSGFERNRLAELVASYGSYHGTDDQLSFGDHTNRFAYYASLSGYRTDHGLEPPTFENLHNQAAGGGVFTSLTYNAHNGDQLRFVGSARTDFYQVPNDPDAHAAGVRDREREQDAFSSFTYLHTVNPSSVLTITPFFHFNRAAFEGGPLDVPSPIDNRASTYYGGQASISYVHGRHNAKAGIYAFGQHDNTFFSLVANDGSGDAINQQQKLNGNLEAIFMEDQIRAARWLTFNLGVRLTRFAGEVTETAPSPRLGVALSLPKLNWTLRGAYSRYYQAPPLSTITGPLLELAASQGIGFLPLHGERDEQYDVGLTIPIKRWQADIDYFQNHAHNFFDHDALGNSNIFFPLTIDHARIRGLEVSVSSPRIFKHASVYLAYSHQKAQAAGAVSGGLTDFSPPQEGYFYLDHDQRDTLSTGFTTDLPWRVWLSGNFSYGSGFLDGDGPQHLPANQTVGLSIGRSFGEHLAAKLTATNLGNSRYYIDRSNTFGGSHVGDPRMVFMQVTWRFHY